MSTSEIERVMERLGVNSALAEHRRVTESPWITSMLAEQKRLMDSPAVQAMLAERKRLMDSLRRATGTSDSSFFSALLLLLDPH